MQFAMFINYLLGERKLSKRFPPVRADEELQFYNNEDEVDENERRLELHLKINGFRLKSELRA